MSINDKELIEKVCKDIQNLSKKDLDEVMSKEVEEAIKRLILHKEYAQLGSGTTCIVNKADLEIILNYIKELETREIEKTNLKIAELEYKLADSTENKVIREKIKDLKAKCGGNVFHVQQTINAEISLLEEILEGEKK